MEFIVLIATVIYIIWLSRLINFGVVTATRIAVASEVSAASLMTIVRALPPDALARAEAARQTAEAAKQPPKPAPTLRSVTMPT